MNGLLPPQSIDLEEAVLGAILLEKDALIQASGEIKPCHFYKDSHRLIYEVIQEMYQDGKQIDLLTVTQGLRAKGKLEHAGGAFYITELTSKIASASHMMEHIKIIQEQYLKREMIRIGSEMVRKGYNEQEDCFELVDFSQLQLINLVGGMITQSAVTIKKSVMDVFQEMAKNMAKKANNEITGIPTPISDLNQFTGGWQKGDLVIIAARPAMGKTGLALSIARSAAKAGQSVLMFSLEMTHEKLTYRLISQETRVKSVTEMQRGDLNDTELKSMMAKTSQLTGYNIQIDDQAKMSLMSLRAKANRMKAQNGLDLIIVDYLQLMGDEVKGGNREQEISRISRGLKILAKDLNIPVIALSQLSRAVETRGGDKRPQLSDLRESGSIEQDADMVIFLYRPEYYDITEYQVREGETVNTKALAVGNIAKHRNGSVGDFLMRFDARYVDFVDWNRSQVPEEKAIDWNQVENNFDY